MLSKSRLFEMYSCEWCPLHSAAAEGNETLVTRLLEDGHDPNKSCKDEVYKTPLHAAASTGNCKIIMDLIRKGAIVDLKNAKGKIPANIAVEFEHMEAVILLMDKKKKNQINYSNLESLFDHQVIHGKLEGIKTLVNNGLKVTYNHVKIAISKRYPDVLKYLLDQDFDVNSIDEKGLVPLHYATNTGSVDLVTIILEKGPYINGFKDCIERFTPMHLAASEGHLLVLDLLIKRGANIELKDRHGETPLWWAVRKHNTEAVKLLLEHNAPLSSLNYLGNSILLIPIVDDKEDLAMILVEAGADIKPDILTCAIYQGQTDLVKSIIARDHRIENHHLMTAIERKHINLVEYILTLNDNTVSKERAFQAAVMGGCVEIIRLFLESHIKLDSTILHHAVIRRQTSTVETLIECGIDVNAQDKNGDTSLLLAVTRSFNDIAELLMKKGADPNLKNNFGLTPIKVALERKDRSLVNIFMNAETFQPSNDDFFNWAILSGEIDSANKIINDQLISVKWQHVIDAISHGHSEIVELFLKSGYNINAFDGGYTALHFAAFIGNSDIIKILVKNGADVNIPTTNQEEATPLICAVRAGSFECVDILITAQANLDYPDFHGQTALWWAVKSEFVEIAIRLVEAGSDIRTVAKDDTTIFAIRPLQHNEEIKKFLNVLRIASNIDIDKIIQRGEMIGIKTSRALGYQINYSHLNSAIRNGHLEVVKYLLNKGFDVNPTEENQTPLQAATVSGHRNIVKYLLEKGANANTIIKHYFKINNVSANIYKCQVAHIAAYCGYKSIITIMQNFNIDFNVKDECGFTPLHYAVFQNKTASVAKLFEGDCNINAVDDNGSSSLHHASKGGNLEMVQILLENEANPTIANKSGSTPLHIAVKNGHASIVELLLNHLILINVNHQDCRGCSPLWYAVTCDNLLISKTLVAAGASVDIPDKDDGNSPLDIAKKKCNNEMLFVLQNASMVMKLFAVKNRHQLKDVHI